MARSIIEYTDAKRPRNNYPQQIISPTHSSACCLKEENIEIIGGEHKEKVGVSLQNEFVGKRGKEMEFSLPFQYRRCRRCGFAVRHFGFSRILELDDLQRLCNIAPAAW